MEKAPNELNYALPWLLMGQIQKLLDTFYPNKKKKHLALYCPFNAVAFIFTGNSVPVITDFHSWCLLHTVLNY
jgi:hypothetical protein